MTTLPNPAETGSAPAAQQRNRRGVLGGAILIVVGLLFLLERILPEFSVAEYWPVVLVVIGVWMLVARRTS